MLNKHASRFRICALLLSRISKRLTYGVFGSVKLSLLIILIIVFIGYGRSRLHNTGSFPNFGSSNGHSVAVHIAIINNVFYHGEVWYSYMYTAMIRAHWNVSLFTLVLPHSIHNEHGLSYMTRSWSHFLFYTEQQDAHTLLNSTSKICSHQITIIATLDVSCLQTILNVLVNNCDRYAVYLVLVQLHEAALDLPLVDQFFAKFPWLLSQKRIKVRLLALASHVKEYAEQNMKALLQVDIWIPVFPIDLAAKNENDQYHQYNDFIIQGSLASHRRNYSGLFDDVEQRTDMLNKHKITFTIVGLSQDHKNCRRFLSPHMRLFISPQYIPANIYYGLIYQSAGILPLFSRTDYYNGTQSSSISTSFLTGTPLMASQRLLETHKHIPKEAVWFKYDNESDIDAVVRIVTSYPTNSAFKKALFQKRQLLGQLIDTFYVNNELTLRNYAELLTPHIE